MYLAQIAKPLDLDQVVLDVSNAILLLSWSLKELKYVKITV